MKTLASLAINTAIIASLGWTGLAVVVAVTTIDMVGEMSGLTAKLEAFNARNRS